MTGEDVLLIPWVYDLEGDNPMQSEMCDHMGLQATYFCRICEARGKDTGSRGGGKKVDEERRSEFMKVRLR
jgi:hypothetical protein